MRKCIMWEDICSTSALDEKLYSSWMRGSSLSDISVHIDDAGVSAASLLSFVVVTLDERRELIEGGVDVPVPCSALQALSQASVRRVANGMPVLLKDLSQEGGWMVDPGLLGNRTATGMTEPQEVLPRIV